MNEVATWLLRLRLILHWLDLHALLLESSSLLLLLLWRWCLHDHLPLRCKKLLRGLGKCLRLLLLLLEPVVALALSLVLVLLGE